ncbi:hypothetical protein ACKI1I_33695 [Streptomyces turgidiscabies]|uniref:Uncharacterized protein n=2 Tax=Streptomyces turgidiscabies TaxID=85558 RepID=L7ES81_STRT8|nr:MULTISPECIES: hypothetical protein [Streptomyces]ELP62283.1 hypothetical protein STRTUCAR8_04757 [Streptomyces turgidiscabies Car8]MDX3498741.1 hypothetical protein [Streptomyces turgidiscabies]GAQ74831.1 hypothetical protein T45_06611 [Streptomyces turgidiscabies]
MTKNRKMNNRPGRAPAGRAGRRPSTSRSTARRPKDRRNDKITIVSTVIQLLRLVWEISQKIN